MARISILGSLAMFTVLASGATPAVARPLVNGSFETGVAYSGGPNIFSPGTPAPWYATSFTPDLYDNTSADGWGIGGIPAYDNMFKGMVACDGHRFIGFAASTDFGGINESFAQQTAPLIPGNQYTVSACIAADDLGKAIPYGGPYYGRGEVNVLLDGNFIGKLTQNTASLTWESRSFTFIAPASSTAVFEFVAQLDPFNPAPSSYIALDDIQITPAPGTLALVGLAGLVAGRRRTRPGGGV
ncbi:MAG: hypothetical protein GIKADHBN_00168 [Phycisphaerales bacterium]|nr:hypothetical protein [Phycisphaerales bacterium]MCK6476642.1 hypothetical protein [Phycisphaerales bacterium]